MADTLTTEQISTYHRDGFVILPAVLGPDECSTIITHMIDLHAGRKTLDGFEPRAPDNWDRVFQHHLYDDITMALLLDPRLRGPIADCLEDEPEAVQTMYFYKGSEQHRHQDQYYLPGCMGIWIALVDVGPENGTLTVQPGSHRGHLVTKRELQERYGTDDFETFDPRYESAVDELVERNRSVLGMVDEMPIKAGPGDVVLFHGALIHGGGPIVAPGAFRHVISNHYIPYSFAQWPHPKWPRLGFDGIERFTTNADNQP